MPKKGGKGKKKTESSYTPRENENDDFNKSYTTEESKDDSTRNVSSNRETPGAEP